LTGTAHRPPWTALLVGLVGLLALGSLPLPGVREARVQASETSLRKALSTFAANPGQARPAVPGYRVVRCQRAGREWAEGLPAGEGRRFAVVAEEEGIRCYVAEPEALLLGAPGEDPGWQPF